MLAYTLIYVFIPTGVLQDEILSPILYIKYKLIFQFTDKRCKLKKILIISRRFHLISKLWWDEHLRWKLNWMTDDFDKSKG